MVYWRHKATGVVIKLKANQKMIDTWERLTDFDVVPKKPVEKKEEPVYETTLKSDDKEVDESSDKQVFSSVKVLKSEADTARNAFTERGAEYSYNDGTWTKVV